MIGRWLDLLTQRWVQWTGKRIDLATEVWLQGPVGARDQIGGLWLAAEAHRLGAQIAHSAPDAGLLASIGALDGPMFAADALAGPVRDFYEHTSRWRLGVSVKWSKLAWPFGWLLAALFGRRLEQLALPMRRRDVSAGMTSTVSPLLVDGRQVTAMWLRRLASTGRIVFSGCYDITRPPLAERNVVRVSFPLPNGRLVVLLDAVGTDGGGLQLSSPVGRWGQPGTYLVVEHGAACWARRIPIHE